MITIYETRTSLEALQQKWATEYPGSYATFTVVQNPWHYAENEPAEAVKIEAYAGFTLGTVEQKDLDGWDTFYSAVAYDHVLDACVEIGYKNTRGGQIPGTCQADADADTKAVLFQAIYIRQLEVLTQRAQEDCQAIKVGRMVRVVRGRKCKGQEGEVRYYGQTKYGYAARVAFPDSGEQWISDGNMEVINPDQYMPTQAAIEASAASYAQKLLTGLGAGHAAKYYRQKRSWGIMQPVW